MAEVGRARSAGTTFLLGRSCHGAQHQQQQRLVTASMASSTAIIHAYRHLYRNSLRAVQFSKPARYTLRDRLRLAFRKGSAGDLEPQRIQQTIEFLQYATKENGLEHKILKNLLFVWWHQDSGGRGRPKQRNAYVLPEVSHFFANVFSTRDETEIKVTAYDTFNHNIRMLNEAMGLCLPSITTRDPN